jgi:hypothetical protein
MWVLQLYIGLFAKLPLNIPGAQGVHFSNRLQPRDQHPAAYITAVPGSLFVLGPWGAFFSYHGQVHTCIVTFFKSMLISLILFRYCFTLGIWLFCAQVLAHRSSTSSLQVYLQHWHVVFPRCTAFTFSSHTPLIFAFRILIPGSVVLTPPFASSVL